ncbi:MAG: phosphate signaling complex PhoU family protein [Acidimicrobiales bacterium]
MVGRFTASKDSGDPTETARLIDRSVIQMFALVEEAVAGATHALLTGDREAARALVASDAALDDLYRELQGLVHEQLMAGGLSVNRKRWLLALLSMLPELERSGDLAEHIAQRAIRSLPSEMPARVRGFVERMGEIACAMWKMAADAYGDRAAGAERIDRLDDEIDDLHVQLTAEVSSGSVPVPVAIELALVGRFYERLGDHAVNITRRVPSRLRSEAIS